MFLGPTVDRTDTFWEGEPLRSILYDFRIVPILYFLPKLL